MHGITDREELELEQLQLAARAKQDIRTMAFNWINAATSTRARMRRLRLANRVIRGTEVAPTSK